MCFKAYWYSYDEIKEEDPVPIEAEDLAQAKVIATMRRQPKDREGLVLYLEELPCK